MNTGVPPVGMRPQDALVFRSYCVQQHLWILVRSTNEHSLKYIGRNGYTPKPIDCKPKTAKRDAGRYELKGLVVDPTIHPDAFPREDLSEVEKIWRELAPQHRLAVVGDALFRVDQDRRSLHFGCLQTRADGVFRYIHGDYDLKDIVEVGEEDTNLGVPGELRGTRHCEIQLFEHDLQQILRDLNTRMGVKMVQHGSEAQFAGHSDKDAINVYRPDGKVMVLNNGAEVRQFYATYLQGRNPVKIGLAEGLQHDPSMWEQPRGRLHPGIRRGKRLD